MTDLLLWPYPVPHALVVASLVYEGSPLGKGRPRFARSGHAYTPEATRAYEEALSHLFRASVGLDYQSDALGRFALRCVFYRPDRRRTDLDNLQKAICDAGNGIVWQDDSQIVEAHMRLDYDALRPRAEVLVLRAIDPSPAKVRARARRKA